MATATEPKVKQEEWDQGNVPMERWGKDHFTTLLYLETRTVDHHGEVDPFKMRTSRRNWRLAGKMPFSGEANIMGKDQYPTRLRPVQGERAKFDRVDLLGGHDDWECLYDMQAEDLLTFEVEDETKPYVRYPLKVIVKLTDKGRDVCKEARKRREETGRATPE